MRYFFLLILASVSFIVSSQEVPLLKFSKASNAELEYKASPDGNYIVIVYDNGLQIAVWDLRTLEQVYNGIQHYSEPSISKFAFEYDEKNNSPSLAGIKFNSGSQYVFYENGVMHENIGLPPKRGFVETLENKVLGMNIMRHEKDKKGNPNYDKPLWSQLQFFDLKTKKWTTKRFEGSSRVAYHQSSGLVYVFYPKETKIYKMEDEFAQKLKLVQNIKGNYFVLHSDLDDSRYVYLIKHHKKKNYIYSNLARFNTQDYSFKILGGGKKTSEINSTFLANYSRYIPTLNYEKTEDGYYYYELSVKDVTTGKTQTTPITATSEAEKDAITAILQPMREARVKAEKEADLAKNQSQIPLFQEFDVQFPQIPNNWQLDYNKLQVRSISTLALSKKLFGNYNDMNAIGKLASGESTHAYLVVSRSRKSVSDNTTFSVLVLDKYGNKQSYTNVGSTQKVRGQFTLFTRLSITTNGTSWSMIRTTETAGKPRKETYSGTCY